MLNINPARALRNRRRGRSGRRGNPCGCSGASQNPSPLGWAGIVGATALAIGGSYWLYTELMNPPGSVVPPGPSPEYRYQVYEGNDGLWTFAIYQNGSLLYTDPGPYQDEAAASAAAENWLAANVDVEV